MSLKDDVKDWSNAKKAMTGIVICCAGLIIIFALFSIGTPDANTKLNVSDVSISPQGYGAYDVTANIVPDKDYSYLEMAIIFYDESGAVIGTSPLVWNGNDIKQGQVYKISGTAYLSGDNVPVKAEIGIFDSVFSGSDMNDAIWTQEVTL